MTSTTGDYVVENHGSIMLVRPLTLDVQAWLQANVADEGEDMAQWFGGALAIEPRYVAALIGGLAEAGFEATA